jgi:hypothetical protein
MQATVTSITIEPSYYNGFIKIAIFAEKSPKIRTSAPHRSPVSTADSESLENLLLSDEMDKRRSKFWDKFYESVSAVIFAQKLKWDRYKF